MLTYTTTPDYYDSAKDLLAEDDHIELDINVEGWAHSLRIRSLTVPQREKINRLAGVGKDRDWVVFHTQTIAAGVVRPKLTPAMAQELVEAHNGELVEELSEAIWKAGGLFQVYRRYREELAALKKAKEQLPDEQAGH